MVEVDTKFALLLSLVNGIGPAKYQKLTEHFHDYESFAANSDMEIFKQCGLSSQQVEYILKFRYGDKADRIQKQAAELGVGIICLGQAAYPEKLKNIYGPPIVLYIKGRKENLGRPAVAVVGSRKATPYGLSMTRKIAGDLARSGLSIISGLALGIDAEAHKAALEAGGITAAVFGCGLDIIYPGKNRELAEQILEHGFWLSEFPFGTPPDKFNFPRRNRIISGLSSGVLVVEAAEKSGALVTAELAVEQGRDVFAVPGQADKTMSRGAINLLKQGAAPVTDADDILESLGWEVTQKLPETGQKVNMPNIDLNERERKICDFISEGAVHFDELVRSLGFAPPEVSSILLKLELTGVIARRPGNFIARA